MVSGLYTLLRISGQTCIDVHIRTFPARFTDSINDIILHRGTIVGARGSRTTRTKKTTGIVCTSDWCKRRRSIGIWILLRRLYTSVLSTIRPAVYRTVRADAGDQPPESSVNVLCESALSCGGHILEFDYISGIQCVALLASYTITAFTDGCMGYVMVGLYNTEHQPRNVGIAMAVSGC